MYVFLRIYSGSLPSLPQKLLVNGTLCLLRRANGPWRCTNTFDCSLTFETCVCDDTAVNGNECEALAMLPSSTTVENTARLTTVTRPTTTTTKVLTPRPSMTPLTTTTTKKDFTTTSITATKQTNTQSVKSTDETRSVTVKSSTKSNIDT